MGLFSNMTEAGATALSSGVGLLGSLGSAFGTAFYNANQSRINRKFQERMYDKQVQDNIKFWNMQNEYALPSAELQRLRDAGINPMLYYQNGAGAGGSQPIATGQVPHGAQAQAHFQSQLDFANLALLKAQIKNIEADTAGKEQSVSESQARTEATQYDTMFRRLTQQLEISLKHGNLDQINRYTDLIRAQYYQTEHMTTQTMLTMMQAREYEVKRFNLDSATIGEQLQQRWKEIANGSIAANAAFKNACAAYLSAQAHWNLSNAQIGQIALNMSQQREMFPLLYNNQMEANWNQIQDRMFKGVQISNEQKRGFEMDMNNYFKSHGVDPNGWWMKAAGPFVIPSLKGNQYLFHEKDVAIPYRYNF